MNGIKSLFSRLHQGPSQRRHGDLAKLESDCERVKEEEAEPLRPDIKQVSSAEEVKVVREVSPIPLARHSYERRDSQAAGHLIAENAGSPTTSEHGVSRTCRGKAICCPC